MKFTLTIHHPTDVDVRLMIRALDALVKMLARSEAGDDPSGLDVVLDGMTTVQLRKAT